MNANTDYIDSQFNRLKPQKFGGKHQLRIRGTNGGETNFMSVDNNTLKLIHELVKMQYKKG